MQATGVLSSANGFEDLLRIDDATIPYAFAQIFYGEGLFARMRNKRRLKLIRSLDEPVREILHEGERVAFVTTGIDYSLFEQYFMGIWSLLLNRRAIVMTTERILLLQVDSKGRLRPLRSQLRYGAIKQLKKGGFGSYLQVFTKQGKKVVLTGIPRADRVRAQQAIDHFRTLTTGDAPANAREHLCGHCHEPQVELSLDCKHCGGAFKSPRKAGLLSLLFPGLGDLYLGHRTLAAMEIFGALVMWALIAPSMLAAATAESETAEYAALAIAMGVVFLIVHGIDALVTRHTARKGLYAA